MHFCLDDIIPCHLLARNFDEVSERRSRSRWRPRLRMMGSQRGRRDGIKSRSRESVGDKVKSLRRDEFTVRFRGRERLLCDEHSRGTSVSSKRLYYP